ncbi:small acid-soluble spore protein Tlp [Alteribacillus sp. HJP-4]|uniref:small acid-soluble spore protein Tlp n=1 Tax=Alteribacillus sp. HJP-4 TaxID=2775394 RepID=UPI0035CCDBC9
MAKPDDRSDNPEKLERMIGHTMQNMNEAKDFVKAHAEEMNEEEIQEIEEKNERRARSIEGYREEIKDETQDSRDS